MADPAPASNAPATNPNPAPAGNAPTPIAWKYKDTAEAVKGTAELFVKLGHGKAEDFAGKSTDDVIGHIYKHFESELGKAAAKPKDGKPATDGKPPADAPIAALPKDDAPAKPNEPAGFKLDETTSFDKIIETAKLKTEDVQKTLRETGSLSDEQLTAIVKETHLPKQLVKQFAEGSLAIQQLREIKIGQAKTTAVTLFGGEEQMTNVLKWAKGHYPADQHETIDAELNDLGTFETRIKSMLFDYAESSGTGGSRPLVNGGGSGGSTGAPWTDTDKMLTELAAFKQRTGKEWHTDPGMRARMEKTPDAVRKGRKS